MVWCTVVVEKTPESDESYSSYSEKHACFLCTLDSINNFGNEQIRITLSLSQDSTNR